MTRLRTAITVGSAIAVATVLPGTASSALVSGDQAVGYLNAQRSAHGLPGDIKVNPDWNTRCAKHMSYIAQNGGQLTHDEVPGRPGYTEEGAWAGANSVLTSRSWPTDGSNPFEFAPIHLMQMLAPQLDESGYASGCMVTLAGWKRIFASQQLFSYPGDGASIYAEETASEMPFVPGDFIGLPQGATTGPHLLVFHAVPSTDGTYWRARGRISSASLIGPDGAVEVRVVDNATPDLGSYFPPGGMVIPADPLRPDSSYTARVRFDPNDETVPAIERQWTFRTTRSGSECDPRVTIGSRDRRKRVRIAWRSCSAGTLAVSTYRGKHSRAVRKQTFPIVRPGPGAKRITVRLKGRSTTRIRVELRAGARTVRTASRKFTKR